MRRGGHGARARGSRRHGSPTCWPTRPPGRQETRRRRRQSRHQTAQPPRRRPASGRVRWRRHRPARRCSRRRSPCRCRSCHRTSSRRGRHDLAVQARRRRRPAAGRSRRPTAAAGRRWGRRWRRARGRGGRGATCGDWLSWHAVRPAAAAALARQAVTARRRGSGGPRSRLSQPSRKGARQSARPPCRRSSRIRTEARTPPGGRDGARVALLPTRGMSR